MVHILWSFRLSSRISKRFAIKWDTKEGTKKQANVNVYLQVQNLLNNQNIIAVYKELQEMQMMSGYLTNAATEAEINTKNDPQSFRDLYKMAVNNPNNYSMRMTFDQITHLILILSQCLSKKEISMRLVSEAPY